MGQLENMRIYVRVVEAGGIGLAAKQLNIAKSAVSRRLSDLENHLGVTLLNRTTRASSITEVGSLYYTHALRIIGDVFELDSLASDPKKSLQGTLRLAAPLSFGLSHLTPALDAFCKEHKELILHVDFSDQYIDLIEGGYDLAIRVGHLESSTLKARLISPINIVMCASPAYLATWGIPEHPSDLKNHKLLHYTFDGINSWKVINKDNEEIVTSIEAKILANNGDFLKQMAVTGHGILIAPTFILWEALNKGDLILILPEYIVPAINAYAVYPKTRYLSQRARLLIDFLLDQFGDKPYWDKKI